MTDITQDENASVDNTEQTDADTIKTPQTQELRDDLDQEGGYLDESVANLTEPAGARDLEAVYDVPVQVTAVIGKASLPVNELFKLRSGKVLELDRKVGEPVDIFVNNRLVARGEVVMTVNDTLGITMTEIVRTETDE